MDKSSDPKSSLMLPKLLMNAKQLLVSVADKNGLTSIQVCVLILLDSDKPQTMISLAQMLNNNPSNVTGLVDRLEAQGLISRINKPSDRRVKLIGLTSTGEKLKNKIKLSLTEAEARLLANLSGTEKETFRTLLGKL